MADRTGIFYNLARLFRTLRYLRPTQFYYRARKIALGRFSFYIARRIVAKSAACSIIASPVVNNLKESGSQQSYHGNRLFEFLNSRLAVDSSWQAPSQSPLWQFNLHYFDYLFSEQGAKEGVELIDSWIDNVVPGDSLAWHPYPTSRRISNWVWYLSAAADSLPANQLAKIQCSMKAQLDFLKLFIERDLLGNHLIANATALLTAGAYLNDQKALLHGTEILEAQLPEQVLPDGGHYERSPMYHQIVLEDLVCCLVALKSAKHKIPRVLEFAINDMSDFLLEILDGEQIPLLNDSAYGIAAEPRKLLNFIAENGLCSNFEMLAEDEQEDRLQHLDSSGLVILRRDNMNLTFDVGDIGPDFLPGHAHNDTLSILLSLNGRQILTDSGVLHYQGDLRNYFRSARAHNVVMLEHIEPNEIWSSFRVGRRGYPENVRVDTFAGIAMASHTGYSHLGINISRILQVLDDGLLWIDIVDGKSEAYRLETNLHFSPECELKVMPDNYHHTLLSHEIFISGQRQAVFVTDEIDCQILSSPYSEFFGQKTDRINLRSVSPCQGRVFSSYAIFIDAVPDNLLNLWQDLINRY